MGDPRHLLGRAAEEAAARLLERSGLRIVARNVRLRHGEIDLVCRDREVRVFVEVKCRQERWDDGPTAAVSWWKRRRLIRLAQHYPHPRCCRRERNGVTGRFTTRAPRGERLPRL